MNDSPAWLNGNTGPCSDGPLFIAVCGIGLALAVFGLLMWEMRRPPE